MAIVNSEPATRRELVLRQTALDTARAWAKTWRDELEGEGRAVEGGWPGTMSEARARIGDHATRAVVRLSMAPLTHEELGQLTRITYDEARRVWRAGADRAA